jgi:hypothetical protein
MVRLSGWVREQNAAVNVPIITSDVLKRVVSMPLPRYRERALKALKVIAKKHPWLDGRTLQATVMNDLEIVAVSYSADPSEVGTLLHILKDQGLLDLGALPECFALAAGTVRSAPIDDERATCRSIPNRKIRALPRCGRRP